MFVAPAVDDVCRFGHHLRWRASDYIKIREVDQNKLISLNSYYHFSSTRPLSQPLIRVVRVFDPVNPSKPCCWRGKWLHHGGDVCVLCLASKKPSEREFFVPAETDLAVKLLSDWQDRLLNGGHSHTHNNTRKVLTERGFIRSSMMILTILR